ncbi:hypothetical protein GZH49_12180 [Nocardia terpenica]|uniref:hypothetical protein n=1 Tax=Nocardia terpenica TaxID=455432 RepID=UPI002FE32675
MPLMKDTTTHDVEGAIKRGASISGHQYVSVKLRDEPSEMGRLLFMQPDKCNHGITICRECAHSWEWDYLVYYNCTAAGRRLRDEIASTTPPSVASTTDATTERASTMVDTGDEGPGA